MNNQPPLLLMNDNRKEFITKQCAICLCTLFYPETGDDMESCVRLQCDHMFHKHCLEMAMQPKCPECRSPILKKINIDRSLELTIRNEAFADNMMDAEMMESFAQEYKIVVKKRPYHAPVFEKWRNEFRQFS